MDAAERLISALEMQLVASPGGWNDRRGLAKFNRLALALMAKLADRRAQERLRDACNWAEILYSTHGHRRRNHGLALLHRAILMSLEHIRSARNGGAAALTVAAGPVRDRAALGGHRYHP